MKPASAKFSQEDSVVDQIAESLRSLSLGATTAFESAVLILGYMICRRFPPETAALSSATVLDVKVEKTLSALEALEEKALSHGLHTLHSTLTAVTTMWLSAGTLRNLDQAWEQKVVPEPPDVAYDGVPQRIAAALRLLSFQARTPLEAAALFLGHSLCRNLPTENTKPVAPGSAPPALLERLSALKFLEQEASRQRLETLECFLRATTALWMSAMYLARSEEIDAEAIAAAPVPARKARQVRH